jgi:fido (protein-threonine AMPylation protein)
MVENRGQKGKLFQVFSPEKNSEYLLEPAFLKATLRGRSIGRYSLADQSLLLIVPYEVINGKSTLVSENKLAELVPKTLEYLRECKLRLDERENGRFKGEGWYCYGRPQNLDRFEVPEKIVLPDVANRGTCCLDRDGKWLLDTAYAITKHPGASIDLRYLLAILNSPLLTYFLKETGTALRGGYFRMKTAYLNPLPFRPINFSDPTDKAKHDQTVSLVERMLDLYKRLTAANTPSDKERVQRQIDATDQEIDRLIYDLYGLTEEEIRIVEASGEPGPTTASVASSSKVKENDGHESEIEPPDRPRASRRAVTTVAQPAQYPSEGGSGTPESPSGAGEPVHGVREPAGQYGSPQDPDDGAEGQSELGSTREFETAEGPLSYQELSERLAVPLVAIYDEILQSRPDQIVITSEWFCLRHKRLAGHLYPDWAGRFRDVNVQVGPHTPPRYYEVPIHMRQFCDDLSVRLLHLNQESVANCAEFLAWADWRFQWIHPFKDFNGRIGRVLLAALLLKLALPHVETAPADPAVRRKYFDALQAADQGELDPLIQLWIRRVEEAL